LGSLPFKQQIDLLVSGIFIMSVTLKICSIPAVLLYSILGFSQQEVLSRGPELGGEQPKRTLRFRNTVEATKPVLQGFQVRRYSVLREREPDANSLTEKSGMGSRLLWRN
jgi:hypothetical protein